MTEIHPTMVEAHQHVQKLNEDSAARASVEILHADMTHAHDSLSTLANDPRVPQALKETAAQLAQEIAQVQQALKNDGSTRVPQFNMPQLPVDPRLDALQKKCKQYVEDMQKNLQLAMQAQFKGDSKQAKIYEERMQADYQKMRHQLESSLKSMPKDSADYQKIQNALQEIPGQGAVYLGNALHAVYILET